MGLHGEYMFSFIRNWQTIFQSGCTTLPSYQKRMGVPVALHLQSSPALGFLSFPSFSHSNWCVMVSHCGFSWYFPNDKGF